MKKLLSFLLIASMLITALVSCDKSKTDGKSNASQGAQNESTNASGGTGGGNSAGNGNSHSSATSLTTLQKYNYALSLIDGGKITEAYELLCSIKTYEPAQEKLENFFYAPTAIRKGNLVWKNGDRVMEYESSSYAYDKHGNLTSLTDENGTVFYFTYDSNGNILSGYDLDYPSDSKVYTYTYSNGRLDTLINNKIVEKYHYNANGTISKIVKTNGYSNSTVEFVYNYTYFANGAVKSMRWEDEEDGVLTEYQYNAEGQIIKAIIYDSYDGTVEFWGSFDISYNDCGVSSVNLYIGDELCADYSYIYDADGRLVEFRLCEEGELTTSYAFFNFTLCYSEGSASRERLSGITKTHVDSILRFFD